MTPIEIIALIFIALSLIKLIVILINKQKWANLAQGIYNSPTVTSILLLVLGGIILFYLLQELTIIQIIATTAFVAILFAFGAMQYSQEVISLMKKAMNKKFTGGIILYILIWLALIIWAIYAMFF